MSESSHPHVDQVRNTMALFATQDAKMATMASAQSAGNVAQVVSAMTASSARSPTSSRGATLARPTGASLAPRRHTDAELDTSSNANQMSTARRDSATRSAQLASQTVMVQFAGNSAPQVRLSAALSARKLEKHAINS